jgi:lipopolysaccharide transport system ATP-binding protein
VSILLEAKELTKTYPKVSKGLDRIRVIAKLLLGKAIPERLSNTVLTDVSLRVERGQSLGIIGENGAGKSTLLKLLTGVIHPSRGSVRCNGRIGALLELGAGFHPDYNGRENIELAGAIYGFTPAELKQKLPEIIEFADIGHYLDEPVKHYSSGMVVRLGFALLAARRPDLLITDEVLAVGDESFQKKCVRWLENYVDSGGTLLLVSHSMYHVQKMCRHAIWLQKGKTVASGDVFDVTQQYLAYHERKNATAEAASFKANSQAAYRLLSMSLNGRSAGDTVMLEQQACVVVHLDAYSPDDRAPVLMLGIVRADGTPVYGVTTDFDRVLPARLSEGNYQIALEYEALELLPGQYTLRGHALDPEGMRLFDTLTIDFTIRGESREFGLVRLKHRWKAD